jgi:hypothetical protein
MRKRSSGFDENLYLAVPSSKVIVAEKKKERETEYHLSSAANSDSVVRYMTALFLMQKR